MTGDTAVSLRIIVRLISQAGRFRFTRSIARLGRRVRFTNIFAIVRYCRFRFDDSLISMIAWSISVSIRATTSWLRHSVSRFLIPFFRFGFWARFDSGRDFCFLLQFHEPRAELGRLGWRLMLRPRLSPMMRRAYYTMRLRAWVFFSDVYISHRCISYFCLMHKLGFLDADQLRLPRGHWAWRHQYADTFTLFPARPDFYFNWYSLQKQRNISLAPLWSLPEEITFAYLGILFWFIAALTEFHDFMTEIHIIYRPWHYIHEIERLRMPLEMGDDLQVVARFDDFMSLYFHLWFPSQMPHVMGEFIRAEST